MEVIVKFFRDYLSGFHYFVYVLILLFFIFAIIGYFVSEKYMASMPKKNKKTEANQQQMEQVSQSQVNQQPVTQVTQTQALPPQVNQ